MMPYLFLGQYKLIDRPPNTKDDAATATANVGMDEEVLSMSDSDGQSDAGTLTD